MKEFPSVCYEIFVRSFSDSNGDGVGDINGIRKKLNYLADLGIEAVWLSPIHPSPSYHHYDVTDYYAVARVFGTLDDFRNLLHEAHALGIMVFLDLVISHTSVCHPWFLESKKGPENPFRDYYYWFTPEEIAEKGVAERETTEDSRQADPWHANDGDTEKYYGIFSGSMADLNFDNQKVRDEIHQIVKYWLDIGVDGFRLDAARHVYPSWETEKNIEFWKDFSKAADAVSPEVYTVGEVWDKGDEVAPYFEGLRANFDFDLSFAIQRILLARKNDGLVEMLKRNYALFAEKNTRFADATLLTNHDQVRIGSVLAGDKKLMKLAATMLLTLPGQPYIYYGEEIGMLGEKPDRFLREPFLWAAQSKENTKWMQPRYSTRKSVVPLSEQLTDKDSLYNHYKNLIRWRKRIPALSRVYEPDISGFSFDDDEILAYQIPDGLSILIIHNLSTNEKNTSLGSYEITGVLFSTDQSSTFENNTIHLEPHSSAALRILPKDENPNR